MKKFEYNVSCILPYGSRKCTLNTYITFRSRVRMFLDICILLDSGVWNVYGHEAV
jgi:hypothetical protein